MISIQEKDKCCGCHACMNICPKGAIKMQEDEFGFKYPIVDKKKCINCGLCEKVCPIINNSKENKTNPEAFVCVNNNENERLNSSSGGIFILLAKEIIKRKGIVFGASFDKDFNVIHTYASTEKELEKFMGSKYVQSIIGETYKKAKEFLDNDRYVLFTGTPCQIEGLKKFLNKDYKKLYTQDIICHGVPSPLVWNKYKEFRQKKDGKNPNNVFFRNKDNGWKTFNMKFIYKDEEYKQDLSKDPYMQAFLKNTSLRESCYNCSFKKKKRVSDITLADYWGVNKKHPKYDDDKGTSLVIIHSSKGRELFDSINKNLKYERTNIDEALAYNTAMTKSVIKDHNRDKFFENLDSLEFDELVKQFTYQIPFHKKAINKLKNIIKRILHK